MRMALEPGARYLAAEGLDNIDEAATSMAADTLMYGQGNSGTILSFFYGVLATEMKHVAKGKNTVTVAELAQIFEATGPPMNGAAMNPQEGTMLSVARNSVAGLSQPPPTSLVDLLGRWVKKANVELAKTPDQLIVNGRKVLAGKGVVDSGAKGFVVMVEGMLLVAQGKLEYKVLEAAGLVIKSATPDTLLHAPIKHSPALTKLGAWSSEELNQTLVQILLLSKNRAGMDAMAMILQSLQAQQDAVLEIGEKNGQPGEETFRMGLTIERYMFLIKGLAVTGIAVRGLTPHGQKTPRLAPCAVRALHR